LEAELGPEIAARALDVTDPEAARSALTGVERLDLLALVAGTNVPERRLEQLTPDSWQTLVATNLTGVFTLVSAALPALRAARGLVIIDQFGELF